VPPRHFFKKTKKGVLKMIAFRSGINGETSVPVSSIYETTVAQKFALGQKYETQDGRLFRYAKAGAAALLPGNMTQSVAPVAHHTNIATGVIVPIGATQFTYVTTLDTTTSLNQYAGGYLHVNDATGEGHSYRIKSNTANVKPTIVLDEPILVALAATSEVTLVKNRFHDTIIAPTTAQSTWAGVPCIDVPATYYYWSLVQGEVPILTHGTVVIGNAVQVGGAAGAVTPLGVNDPLYKQVGTVMTVNATTEYSVILLDIL